MFRLGIDGRLPPSCPIRASVRKANGFTSFFRASICIRAACLRCSSIAANCRCFFLKSGTSSVIAGVKVASFSATALIFCSASRRFPCSSFAYAAIRGGRLAICCSRCASIPIFSARPASRSCISRHRVVSETARGTGVALNGAGFGSSFGSGRCDTRDSRSITGSFFARSSCNFLSCAWRSSERA